jgi:chemosensory pili system protein ChpA (sensor histidine kinase/response regulator)
VVRKVEPDVVVGFIGEAKGYLPAIRQGIAAFRNQPGQVEKLEEAYRLIHIIKGASSMVGLSGLNHVACQLEETVEGLAAGQLPLNEDTERLLVSTLQLIESHLDGAASGGPREEPSPPVDTPAPDPLPDLPELPSFLADLPEPEAFGSPADLAAPDLPLPESPAEPQEVSPELLEVFTLEAEEHLRTLSTLVPTLEHDPANKESLQEIRRSAHTLKGCAALVGFHSLTQLAHRMEDLLDLLYEGEMAVSPEVIGLLLASTDALEDMAAGKAQAEAVQALYARYADLLGATPPSPEAGPEELALPQPPEPSEAAAPGPEAGQVDRPASRVADRKRQYVRIPIERLDDVVKLVTELVITRSSLEQRMTDFARQLGELQLSTDRLWRISHKLETEYEASALGGGRLAAHTAPLFGEARPPAAPVKTHGFDDLEFDRYTEFHLQSRALAETTNDIRTVAGDLGHVIGDFDGFLTRQARLAGEIEDKLMRLRMVPLATLASRLSRAVRNVAEQEGKQVEFVLEGESTELDKTVLEEMADPLLHLVRNAAGHGIEPPGLRQARGKPAQGAVRLRAFHEGSQVVIQVSDDGAGLDPARIRAEAVRKGLLPPQDAAQSGPEDLFPFIFLPGFSTAPEVSEVSGRGVGLDVVKAQVHKLKGTLTVASQPGLGATFTVRLPLTLAITRALLVKAHQETFALPLDGIQQILRLDREDVEHIGKDPVVRVGGRVYPLVSLGKLLSLRQPADDTVRRPPVIILSVGGRQVALTVDHLLGGKEIVIKNLGSHLRRVKGVAGATLLGDGRVVLILNPAELVGEAAPAGQPARPLRAPLAEGREALMVMVVDDSPSMRRVVTTLLKKAGWQPVAAKDGLEALEVLHQSARLPDLLLLDVEMPRMDGYELLSTLKAQEAYANIPVVMVTSRAGEKHRRKALDLGASGYVMKPYQEEALLNTIRRLVREARQAVLA